MAAANFFRQMIHYLACFPSCEVRGFCQAFERFADIVALVYFRFYAELNRFIHSSCRQRSFLQACAQDATVKHMIEALGVPHTEVELILLNGQPVDWSYRLQEDDRVSVYPWFSLLACTDFLPGSLRQPGDCIFIADAHLGRLARDLRMLGFDVLYGNALSDDDVVRIAVAENRIVLSRDRDLLIRKSIARGCYLYATAPDAQLAAVIDRYRLAGKARPLSRCLRCNGLLRPVEKQQVQHRLPTCNSACKLNFFICAGCSQVYWDGTHVKRMRQRIAGILASHGLPA